MLEKVVLAGLETLVEMAWVALVALVIWAFAPLFADQGHLFRLIDELSYGEIFVGGVMINLLSYHLPHLTEH